MLQSMYIQVQQMLSYTWFCDHEGFYSQASYQPIVDQKVF